MNNIKRITIFVFSLLLFCGAAFAQNSKVIDLWSQGAPNDNGNPADTARMHVFLPRHSIGRTVVICPGGGYSGLAMNHTLTTWVSPSPY